EADKADLYLIVHSYERRMNFLNTKGQRVKVFEEDKLYPSLFQPLTLCPFVLKSVLIKAQSEAKLQAVLKLKRIRGVARRVESENRIRRHAEVRSSVYSVQVGDVDAIEQIEEVGAEFGSEAFVEAEFARDSQVEAGEARTFERVPSQIARTVGERIAVAIRVRTGEDIEASAGLSRQ